MNGTVAHACPEDTDFCEDCEYGVGRHGGGYGEAIWQIPSAYYDESIGHWTVGNGEYSSCVNFCPYCGLDLRTLPLEPSRYALYTCNACGSQRVDYRFPDKDLDNFCSNHGVQSRTDNGFRMTKTKI